MMTGNRKSIVLVCLTLSIFAVPQVMSSAPAEAGAGYHIFWKQKRERLATEKRQQRKQAKSHNPAKRFDPATQALRQRLFDGAPLSPAQLRVLADKGEGLAAVRYAQAMQQDGGANGLAVAYFAKAAAQGRKDAVKPFLAFLRTPDAALSSDDLRIAETSLLALSRSGNVDAMTGLAQFYLTGLPFGSNENKALEMLELAARNGDGDAAVQAGLMMEKSGAVPADRNKALQMYQIAAKQGNLIALSKVQSATSAQ